MSEGKYGYGWGYQNADIVWEVAWIWFYKSSKKADKGGGGTKYRKFCRRHSSMAPFAVGRAAHWREKNCANFHVFHSSIPLSVRPSAEGRAEMTFAKCPKLFHPPFLLWRSSLWLLCLGRRHLSIALCPSRHEGGTRSRSCTPNFLGPLFSQAENFRYFSCPFSALSLSPGWLENVKLGSVGVNTSYGI